LLTRLIPLHHNGGHICLKKSLVECVLGTGAGRYLVRKRLAGSKNIPRNTGRSKSTILRAIEDGYSDDGYRPAKRLVTDSSVGAHGAHGGHDAQRP